MSKIVAARFWVCEFCPARFYDFKVMKEHLKGHHSIDIDAPEANGGTLGDNYIVSDMVVPQALGGDK